MIGCLNWANNLKLTDSKPCNKDLPVYNHFSFNYHWLESDNALYLFFPTIITVRFLLRDKLKFA